MVMDIRYLKWKTFDEINSSHEQVNILKQSVQLPTVYSLRNRKRGTEKIQLCKLRGKN